MLGAVVYGSAARGDFNLWSDVDVLLIVARLPERQLDRLDLLQPRPARVEPMAWTPAEWRNQLGRGNPIALEAVRRGVWLHGSADELSYGPAEELGEA